MFNFFKKTSKKEKLELQHKQLLEEAFKLSKTNRVLSDKKLAEAEEILKQITSL